MTLEPGCSPLDWARLAGDPGSADALRGLAPGTPYLRVSPSQLRERDGRRPRPPRQKDDHHHDHHHDRTVARVPAGPEAGPAPAWMALGGRVYNVGPYLRFHPGGAGELLRGAGRDATRLFAEVHPWVNYETMLAACLVGVLVGEGEEGGCGDGDGGAMEEMD